MTSVQFKFSNNLLWLENDLEPKEENVNVNALQFTS